MVQAHIDGAIDFSRVNLRDRRWHQYFTAAFAGYRAKKSAQVAQTSLMILTAQQTRKDLDDKDKENISKQFQETLKQYEVTASGVPNIGAAKKSEEATKIDRARAIYKQAWGVDIGSKEYYELLENTKKKAQLEKEKATKKVVKHKTLEDALIEKARKDNKKRTR